MTSRVVPAWALAGALAIAYVVIAPPSADLAAQLYRGQPRPSGAVGGPRRADGVGEPGGGAVPWAGGDRVVARAARRRCGVARARRRDTHRRAHGRVPGGRDRAVCGV